MDLNQNLKANQNILDMEYAVRGRVAQRAAQMAREGREIIPCNIGNPQALGQTPLTYLRETISLLENPKLISRERELKELFEDTPGCDLKEQDFIPDDILELCESLLSKSRHGLGAYTESKGFLFVREAIADFINQRDEHQAETTGCSNPDHIFLTNGASQGATFMIDILISDPKDGIMIPIPQYPLYSATIKKAGGTQINYYPNEEQGWAFDRSVLEDSYNQAVADGVKPKAIVIINPGNPTGSILSAESILEIVDFAENHNLIIIADEVYQENVYNGAFTSFAKVAGTRPVCIASLHSISKGFYGECGHRGGYLEIRNPPPVEGFDGDLVDILNKMASVSLCSNTVGQLLTYLMVSSPINGSTTVEKFNSEKEAILKDLFEKAAIIRKAFEKMDGMECYGETGALYLFPKISKMPVGKTDFDYCMELLEETGLCVVNGSGFGQVEGTHHLRIAFLPPKATLEKVLPQWINFHNNFVNQ